AELVDAPDLGSGAARCESSSLSFRTILTLEIERETQLFSWVFFYLSKTTVYTNKPLSISLQLLNGKKTKPSRSWVFT
ncbi:hypothetical protein, partial [Vibrio hepatarius]|uniref:hypothetical protein n=1 Tax=Vibrio hepatarius TaxID=171383 RepID=UPI0037356348